MSTLAANPALADAVDAHAVPPREPDRGRVHEPFDDRAQQRTATTLGMWLFLGTELLLFGGMIGAYTVYRALYPAAWEAGSRHLYEWIGVTNTAVLLTSSFWAALAVWAAGANRRGWLMAAIALTILFGAGFLGLKGCEWYLDIAHEHLLPGYDFQAYHGSEPNAGRIALFLSFYWTMTAVHAVHMTIGLSIWAGLLVQVYRRRLPSASSDAVEIFAMYWHFVDIVWIFLLPLLYLVR